MYLADLQDRLIETARRRVRSGMATERGLAKQCGLSQPHMHNVLKNIRELSPQASDRLMRALSVTTADLLWPSPADQNLGVRGVPVVRQRIGPGVETNLRIFRGAFPLPASLVDGLVDPVVVRLAPDLALPPDLAANDIVLLDQNPLYRSNPSGDGTWLIASEGGFRVRYAQLRGELLYAGERLTNDRARDWQEIDLAGRNILDVIRARIVWMSREIGWHRNAA